MKTQDLINSGKICPYCKKSTVFVDSIEVYGQSYGNIYLCRDCKAWVGVHKDTNQALGSLANSELRDWRREAHACFDPLWRAKIAKTNCSKTKARVAAYKWLSNRMKIDIESTHISWFNVEQCKKVIEICKPYLKNIW